MPADRNTENCIENFEAEVLRIINANPDNTNKGETQKIMHEIMSKKVEANCESEFEKETKEIVHTKEKE
jgi:hypothetical protein